MGPNNNNMLPLYSNTSHLGALTFADELSRVANALKWLTSVEIGEIRKMAKVATATDYSSLGGVLDISAVERGHVYQLLLASKGGRAWVMRKIPYLRNGAQPPQHGKQLGFQGVDIFAEIDANTKIKRTGKIARPPQEAAGLSGRTSYGGLLR